MKRQRLWCFTQFDMDFDFKKLFEEKITQIRFLAWGRETCPETGREHFQGFVYFHNVQGNVGKLNKWFGSAHLSAAKGTLAENEAYCSKEENYVTLGDKPPGRGARTDIEAEVERVLTGNVTCDQLVLENPAFMHQYGRTMDRVEDIALRKRCRETMTVGTWYTGPTGAGKSHACFDDFNPETHYVKPLKDQWWDGYKGQEIVILNEFRGEIPYGELMALVDEWPHYVRRRGREPVPFLAKQVKVSSIMSPKECYSKYLEGSADMSEFDRRFQVTILPSRQNDLKCSEGNTEPQSKKPKPGAG